MAGVEAVIFGLLVLVIGTLIIANAWAVVDAKIATVDAARQAARAAVEAPDADAALAAARTAADSSLEADGRDASRVTVQLTGILARCQRVQVVVSLPIGLVGLPVLGRPGRLVTVRSTESELVDPYRSGLPGTAECAGG